MLKISDILSHSLILTCYKFYRINVNCDPYITLTLTAFDAFATGTTGRSLFHHAVPVPRWLVYVAILLTDLPQNLWRHVFNQLVMRNATVSHKILCNGNVKTYSDTIFSSSEGGGWPVGQYRIQCDVSENSNPLDIWWTGRFFSSYCDKTWVTSPAFFWHIPSCTF